MAIVGALPFNIQDGQIIDAVPVMANLNFLANQVNANVPPLITTTTSPVIFVPSSSVGGTATAITFTPTPALGAYAAGQMYSFVAKFANTAGVGVSINVSGLGARVLLLANGNGLLGGEMQANGTYLVCDNGTNYMLMNSPLGSGLVGWTPALSFGGASVGITYSTQVGTIMTVGNLVISTWALVLTSKGSSTGIAQLSLPLPPNATYPGSGLTPFGPFAGANITFASGYLSMAPLANQLFANIQNVTSAGAIATLTNTAFANNSSLFGFQLYSV
jgi:hypothetical protein